jgi:hypothetical protein
LSYAGNGTDPQTPTQTGLLKMSATQSFARYLALPIVTAGVLGGAALGLAGMANAGTYSYHPEPRPGLVATPNIVVRPPLVATPRHHRSAFSIDVSSAGSSSAE